MDIFAYIFVVIGRTKEIGRDREIDGIARIPKSIMYVTKNMPGP